MEQVLEGIKVLDFSRYASAPTGTMLLADMGAEVIKVEKPGGSDDRDLGPFTPDGQSIAYGIVLSRNKKSITLNLRSQEGKKILRKLVKTVDVVVHNFAVGSEEAEVLNYESLKQDNPSLILAVVTGFGQYGPYAERTCFDSIAQAISGAMSYTGFPGNPPTRAGAPYADFGAGFACALGVMFALHYRQKTGIGQLVDISMLDVAFTFVAGIGVAAEYKLLNYARSQQGNHSFYNYTNSFKTKDGWVMIGIVSNGLWRRFVRVIGREDLLKDPRCKDDMSRYLNSEFINSIVSPWMAEKTVDEVIALLEKARLPCGRINSVGEAVNDPQLLAREMIVEIEQPGAGKVPISGVSIKLSETPGEIRTPAPAPGEHSEEIYCGLLGFSPQEFLQLKEKGII